MLKGLWYLTRETLGSWQRDNVAGLAAALAFYTVFSLAPLLIIVVGIASIVTDQTMVVNRIALETNDLIGPRGENLIRTIIEEGGGTGSGVIATVVGLVTLMIGATAVFAELQGALNRLWKVEPRPTHGIIALVRARILSFAMILVIGFLLLVSLVVSVVLAAVGEYLAGLVPETVYLMRGVSLLISIIFIAFLFALIYRYLPDAHIAWRDVWIGAVFTAILFSIGKYPIGLYLGNAPFGAAYGAAGSLAVILVWVYFSSQIVLLGAEFTKVYALRYGSRILSYAEMEAMADQPQEPPQSEGSMANF